MSFDLTSLSSGASTSSGESHKPGIRDKLLALKQKAALPAGEPTYPAFVNSFGDRLNDLDGRRRWLLDGLARERWDPDLRGRVREILRENEGEIHKGRNIQRTSTVSHCWMLGYDATRAHPTVVISCNHATVLMRTMKIISQHGVLKEAKFVLKGIPFCDLKYMMCPGKDDLAEEHFIVDGNSETQHAAEDQPTLLPSPSFDDHQNEGDQAIMESMCEDEDREEKDKRDEIGSETKGDTKGKKFSAVLPVQFGIDTVDQDPLPLRVGAEDITIPNTGRLITLGGFIMVDDVCFGLTAVHAFTEENDDDYFGQQSIPEDDIGLHLYDSDWANDDSSDSNDG